MTSEKYILVGLGNPGEKYAGTRHNVGFVAVDAILRAGGDCTLSEKWEALTTRISLHGQDLCCVKPLTYMNLSGKAVVRFADFYKVPVEKIIVIHDDIDMKTGRLKLVKGGGAGGHNGIRSMVDSLGKGDFYRLKVGIGRPGSNGVSSEMPVDRYVLGKFTEPELDILRPRMADVLHGLDILFTQGPAKAMNFINSCK